jgi:adenylate kinase
MQGKAVVNNIIIVVGIPGSGKSTALAGIEQATGARVVSLGTEMAKRAGADDRDLLRKDPDAEGKAEKLRREVLEDVLNSSSDTVIIDTHALVKTPEGYISGFSEGDLKLLNGKVKAIVYVYAEPEKIAERRASDRSRKRDDETTADIAEHEKRSREFCKAMSDRLGAQMHSIDNTNISMDETKDKMRAIVKQAVAESKSINKTKL